MHHTSHHISDQNSCALQQFIKADLKEVCEIFVNENDRIDNMNVDVKSQISQTNHFMVKRGTF